MKIKRQHIIKMLAFVRLAKKERKEMKKWQNKIKMTARLKILGKWYWMRRTNPVRMSGMVIGAPQTYDYFKRIQDRITGFIASHSDTTQEQIEAMMMETGEMTKDLGRILVGEDAVKEGLINEVGGIHDALEKLKELMKKREEQEEKEEQDINS